MLTIFKTKEISSYQDKQEEREAVLFPVGQNIEQNYILNSKN